MFPDDRPVRVLDASQVTDRFLLGAAPHSSLDPWLDENAAHPVGRLVGGLSDWEQAVLGLVIAYTVTALMLPELPPPHLEPSLN